MRIGILGSGRMGGKLGTIFARAGHEVVFSYARTKGKLEKIARDAGARARAGTPAEAAKDADALKDRAAQPSRIGSSGSRSAKREYLSSARDGGAYRLRTCSTALRSNGLAING